MNCSLRNCPDCNAEPGNPHIIGCDVERCSVCAGQRFGCECDGHDPLFARWTGLWPGEAESQMLNLDLNGFYMEGYNKIFFTKPQKA